MFRRFTAKTVQDAVNLACQELNVTVDDLNYEVISETKTFFTKRAEIECYTCLLYTSTPCKPPDTLYPPPPNFPPACNTVKIVSTVEIPVFA